MMIQGTLAKIYFSKCSMLVICCKTLHKIYDGAAYVESKTFIINLIINYVIPIVEDKNCSNIKLHN